MGCAAEGCQTFPVDDLGKPVPVRARSGGVFNTETAPPSTTSTTGLDRLSPSVRTDWNNRKTKPNAPTISGSMMSARPPTRSATVAHKKTMNDCASSKPNRSRRSFSEDEQFGLHTRGGARDGCNRRCRLGPARSPCESSRTGGGGDALQLHRARPRLRLPDRHLGGSGERGRTDRLAAVEGQPEGRARRRDPGRAPRTHRVRLRDRAGRYRAPPPRPGGEGRHRTGGAGTRSRRGNHRTPVARATRSLHRRDPAGVPTHRQHCRIPVPARQEAVPC